MEDKQIEVNIVKERLSKSLRTYLKESLSANQNGKMYLVQFSFNDVAKQMHAMQFIHKETFFMTSYIQMAYLLIDGRFSYFNVRC